MSVINNNSRTNWSKHRQSDSSQHEIRYFLPGCEAVMAHLHGSNSAMLAPDIIRKAKQRKKKNKKIDQQNGVH